MKILCPAASPAFPPHTVRKHDFERQKFLELAFDEFLQVLQGRRDENPLLDVLMKTRALPEFDVLADEFGSEDSVLSDGSTTLDDEFAEDSFLAEPLPMADVEVASECGSSFVRLSSLVERVCVDAQAARSEYRAFRPTDPAARIWWKAYYTEVQALANYWASWKSAVVKLANTLCDMQPDFIQYGPEALRPLSTSEVAERIGWNIRTVQRVLRGKTIGTPHGIFDLRALAPQAVGSGESGLTHEQLRNVLLEIIESEDPRRPFSDAALVKQLQQRCRVTIERRQVQKLRERWSICSSRDRRRNDGPCFQAS